jgi:fimbrial chaperone protein
MLEHPTRRIAKAVLLAGGLVVASAALVRAADFTISPTTITLTNEPAADVALTNTGNSIARITVHAYAWSQTPDEPEKLTASDKVIYYPQIFALPPAGTQRIRVGVAGAPTGKEQAYRLIIQELPPNTAAGTGSTGVTFVGRVDMPVFVPPGNSIAQTRVPKFVSLSVERGQLHAVLTNEGSIHLRQSTLAISGTDASGNTVWRDTKQVFYVLPDSVQNVSEPIPASICSRLRSVAVRWTLRDNAGTLDSTTRVDSCK